MMKGERALRSEGTSHVGGFRILVIDDNPAIHADFAKILSTSTGDVELAELESSLFGTPVSGPAPARPHFTIDSAYQGAEGLALVQRALTDGKPYAVVFVDVRMPPGWDGVETLMRIFEVDTAIQAVLCTAYTDYDWNTLRMRFSGADRLLVLRKPFEVIEALQMALALSEKWKRQAAHTASDAALRRSEARHRALLEAMPDLLLCVDGDGRILERRAGGTVPIGVEAAEDIAALAPPGRREEIFALLQEALAGGGPRSTGLRLGEAGEERDYDVHIAPLVEGEALVLLRDVTERRRSEAEEAQAQARQLALEMQVEALSALSTPLIPLRAKVLVMPLVGEIDLRRSERMQTTLLEGIAARGAHTAILDVTGVPRLDSDVAERLARTATAVRLLGAELVISGLSPDTAQHIVKAKLSLGNVSTVRTLEAAVDLALMRR